ncbi:hypothetical protein [Acinetobacter sp. neg1]|uniref:hypothetical protein n=1 Tax=Acinetobacter sp. neg1 TaxID=1561068 RepID=UPI00068D7F9F|nr:hypothetical protein [Acinetobacter sp. neg1]
MGKLITLVLIVFLLSCSKKPQEKLDKDINDIEKRTVEIVKGNLNKPESAIFRNLNGVCGEVSSIDGNGKQSKFIRFVLDTEKHIINYDYGAGSSDPEFEAHFQKLWKQNCVLR